MIISDTQYRILVVQDLGTARYRVFEGCAEDESMAQEVADVYRRFNDPSLTILVTKE